MRTAHEMRARATHCDKAITKILTGVAFDNCGPRDIVAGLKQLEATLWEVTAELCDRLDDQQQEDKP